MDSPVKYKCSHIHKDPVFKVTEKKVRGNLIIARFAFPFPLAWYGDSYTYDPGHIVEEVFIGEDEEDLLQRIRSHVQTILAWENRKATENIGSLVQIEDIGPAINKPLAKS